MKISRKEKGIDDDISCYLTGISEAFPIFRATHHDLAGLGNSGDHRDLVASPFFLSLEHDQEKRRKSVDVCELTCIG